jgi:hypothetical protein
MLFLEAELEAYIDEALPADRMAAIEEAVRGDGDLLRRLAAINARRDAGVHSLGEIWRRNRLTCPTREQLGSYLLNVLPDETVAYIRFHLRNIGCRYCDANLADLQSQQAERATADRRRRKFFQSSAGYLEHKR